MTRTEQTVEWLTSVKGRRWVYGVCMAAVALLAGYGIVADEAAPLWIGLAASVLGMGTVDGVRAARRRRRQTTVK